jgi:hypothetical protein
MSDRPNALQMPPAPGSEDNPLMGGATLADAWDANRQSYADWLARDRQRQIDLGYVDPTTGQLTPEGWRNQAQTIAGGFGPADIGMATGLLGSIKTYHGSPHLFPPTPKNPLGEFDLAKIGTGEGNQSFGKGAYVAEAERVAREGYRDPLAAKRSGILVDGAPAENANLSPGAVQMAQMHLDGTASLDNLRATNEASLAAANARLAQYPNSTVDRMNAEMAQRSLAALDELKGKKVSADPNAGGHMYEVNLNAEPHEFLHWDKLISEQSPQVLAALAKIPWAEPYLKSGDKFTAAQIVPHTVEGAEQLRAAGIPGVRYLDRSSRGSDPNAPDATHNYAVFDPEKMEIIRRFGIAGLIGGGAAATAAGGQDQGNQ